MPDRAANSFPACNLRSDGMWSTGPNSRPIFLCPREIRCAMACSTATASSHDTRGNGSSSIDAFTSTTGRASSTSRP